MDNLVKSRIGMGVRSITGSSGRRPNIVVQNPDQRDFSGKMENTPPMTTSSRTELNIDQDMNDETRNIENLENGDFPVLRPNHDRQTHTHHN